MGSRNIVVPLSIAAAMLIAGGGYVVAPHAARSARRLVWPELSAYESIRVNMTEAEVLARLGPPTKRYDAATAPADYYVPGYGYEKRAITGKVYIYVSAEPILYVYFGRNNRVEHTVVGGT